MDFFDPSFDSHTIFANSGAIVFIIDAQVLIETVTWKKSPFSLMFYV